MRRLLRFLRRESADTALAAEMREHMAEKIDDLVDVGMSRGDAEREVRRRFGNIAAFGERSRDEWGYGLASSVAQDLRHTIRTLKRNPFFAAVVVLPLALGIGANTAIFTVVHAALIRPLPYRDAGNLVHLWEVNPGKEHRPYEASYLDFGDWKTAQRNFEGMAAYADYGLSATLNEGQEPEQLVSAVVTTEFFPLLGVKAAVGRTFAPGEDQPGAANVVMLSHAFWRRRFHGDTSIVGRTMNLNAAPTLVIGVLPPNFHFASVGDTQVWLPFMTSPRMRASRFWHSMKVIGRLRPGATLAQARAELAAIGERIAREDPQHHATTSVIVQPLHEQFVGDVKPALLVLLGAIAMVLLLACANVANLLLARAAARRKELALRGSLGASRGRLVQQLLTESLLLALIGGTLGLVFARWGIGALVAAVPADMRSRMPYLEGLGIHWGMLAFTAGVSVVIGVLFGLAPALRLAKTDLHAALESGHRATGGREHLRLRHALLVAEVAISLVLLTGAGLMMKSTARLLEVNPGFNPQRLLTIEMSLPRTYTSVAKAAAFHDRLLERIAALPGVTGAGTTSALSLANSGNTGTLQVVGRPTDSEKITAYIRDISSGYLRAMGIPLLAGRNFDDRDVYKGPRVVLVNQRTVRAAFGKEDPVGKRIAFPWIDGTLEIVGVVGDENTVSLDTELRPVVYFPYRQSTDGAWGLVVRAGGSTAGLASAIRAETRALDPAVPVYAVRTMEQVIADAPSTVMRRYPAMLMAVFAGIALLMATIGTYGLVAYGVSQRMHEIGVRIALGAGPADILRLVMGQGIGLALAGIAVGLVCAAVVTRGLEKLLYGVKPLDPATFAVVVAVLLGAAVMASFIPSRRATRVAPGIVMGSE
jgi:putative ABC transport system permease protein